MVIDMTNRERALEAALRHLCASARTFRNVPKAEQEWTPLDDAALDAGFAALALPPSPQVATAAAGDECSACHGFGDEEPEADGTSGRQCGWCGGTGKRADEATRDAAPDMLAALQRLLDAPDLNLGNLEEETISAVAEAQAAVARATGKES